MAMAERKLNLPFSIAAFPDLIASDAMLAITSGLASNMMRRTPMGQVTLSSSKPSSRSVRNVTLLTKAYRISKSHASQVFKIESRRMF